MLLLTTALVIRFLVLVSSIPPYRRMRLRTTARIRGRMSSR